MCNKKCVKLISVETININRVTGSVKQTLFKLRIKIKKQYCESVLAVECFCISCYASHVPILYFLYICNKQFRTYAVFQLAVSRFGS